MVAAGVALSGCGSTQSSNTIDGFTLGVLVKCSPPVDVDAAALDASCAGFPTRAMAALDARDPGHAAIVSTVTYADGTQPGTTDLTGVASPPLEATRHPGPNVTVFVFKLADGTTRATGVACSGDPMTCVGVGSYPGDERKRHALSALINGNAKPDWAPYHCSGVTTKSSGSFTPVEWFGQ
jgi:hypothetical protein